MQNHAAILPQIASLEALARDLRSVIEGTPTTVGWLAEPNLHLPLLDNWRYSTRPTVCLEGMSTGHPLLPGKRRPIRTSELWLISEELGWARTYSRWYLLGRRCDAASERH